MSNQEIVTYIKQQQQQGVSRIIITASLTAAGWKNNVIDQAFIDSQNSQQEINSRNTNIYTEKNYPIQTRWIIKNLIHLVLLIIFFILIGSFAYLIIFVIYTMFYIPLIILRRSNFHYTVEEKYLTVKQGVLNKQQRHIPYGVIQNVFVKQGLLDRLLSLASLAIENASEGGGAKFFKIKDYKKQDQTENVGFSGNKISIPGLSKQDAEALKLIILAKIKQNPINDSGSGL